MNRFLITFLAVFMAVALALLGYDYLIVQPREAEKTKVVEVHLDKAEQEAKGIADSLDIAVQESVNNANESLNAQADEMQQRELANDALSRASMFKVALSEYYVSIGKWPKDQAAAGLAAPESYAGGAVSSISVAGNGIVTITLNDKIQAGGKIKLMPDVNPQSYVVNWRCTTEGSEVLKQHLQACNQ